MTYTITANNADKSYAWMTREYATLEECHKVLFNRNIDIPTVAVIVGETDEQISVQLFNQGRLSYIDYFNK